MVDITATILRKIDEAAIFVADLTTIGVSETGRQMPNPNVLIELGYAMKCMPLSRVLLVANTEWRFSVERLPFDIRHRRGPIAYRLGRDAGEEERSRVFEQLVQQLETALQPMVAEARVGRAAAVALEPTPSTTDPARWWERSEILAHFGRSSAPRAVTGPRGPLIYLRVTPVNVVPRLSEIEIEMHARQLEAPTEFGSRSLHRNERGCLMLSHIGGADGDPFEVLSATQLFHSREIWAIDVYSAKSNVLPMQAIEKRVDELVRLFVNRMEHDLGVNPPVKIEFGLGQAKNRMFPISRQHVSRPCLRENVVCSVQLDRTDERTVDDGVAAILSQFWEAFAVERPEHANGIPPVREVFDDRG